MGQPLFWLGFGLLLGLVLFSFVGPDVWRRSAAYDVNVMLHPPGRGFPLGTDALGRDNLWELMLGGQTPILTGFATAIASAAVGIAAGLAAGLDRRLEGAVLRIADGVLSIPQIVPIVLIEALLGDNVYTLMGVVALTLWPATARLVWGRIIVLRELPFVEAARAEGLTGWQILWRHIVPNAFDTIAACFASTFASSVLFIALATALGVGLGPPWNWATMIGTGMEYASYGVWWLIVPPGILFAALIISVYLVMEAARQAWNPLQASAVPS